MSEKAALAFCSKIRDDAELQAKITNTVSTGSPVDLVAVGAEQGFEFDAKELRSALRSLAKPGAELSDSELESVSGGTSAFDLLITGWMNAPGPYYYAG